MGHSEETKRKIGLALSKKIVRHCAMCNKEVLLSPSKSRRKKRAFCSMKCYAIYRKDVMPPWEQQRWTGGVSNAEAHRRWKAKNPGRMAHLKAMRYARERNAEGSYTFEEWEKLKAQFGNKCAFCRKETKLTRDHIIPLSKGGTNYISNIQPLCRSCNSKKNTKIIHQNPELLEAL